MSLEIKTKELKRVDIVQPIGRIDSSTAPSLEQALQRLIDAGRHSIVIDFSGVEYISSAGLRALISAQKQVKRAPRRGEIRIANMSEKVHKAFDLAGFLELFQLYDSDVDAVGSF